MGSPTDSDSDHASSSYSKSSPNPTSGVPQFVLESTLQNGNLRIQLGDPRCVPPSIGDIAAQAVKKQKDGASKKKNNFISDS